MLLGIGHGIVTNYNEKYIKKQTIQALKPKVVIIIPIPQYVFKKYRQMKMWADGLFIHLPVRYHPWSNMHVEYIVCYINYLNNNL